MHAAEAVARRVGRVDPTPEHGLEARFELALVERLHHVVVGADFQRVDHPEAVGPLTEHDDRHERRSLARSDQRHSSPADTSGQRRREQ